MAHTGETAKAELIDRVIVLVRDRVPAEQAELT
jgi:hypothetical protein